MVLKKKPTILYFRDRPKKVTIVKKGEVYSLLVVEDDYEGFKMHIRGKEISELEALGIKV